MVTDFSVLFMLIHYDKFCNVIFNDQKQKLQLKTQ